MVLEAKWDSPTQGVAKGTGQIHIWNRTKFTAAGTALTGETISCGTVLPPFKLEGLGLIAGGGKSTILVEVPFDVWDKPTMPKFVSKGTIGGWSAGSSVDIEPTVALVGVTMTDPAGAWPKAAKDLTVTDPDGDAVNGFLAVPRSGEGDYTYPPIGISGVFGSRADKLYLASRTVVGLKGKLDTCTEQSGTVDTKFFDSHVVNCHVENGGACTPDQIKTVDETRTQHQITSGTFKAKEVAADATCADIRAALPL
jgi:hypothetical protein